MSPKYRSGSELYAARDKDGLAITLMGMSGVGKTTLARALAANHWFHYSGDYRIGTHHLEEAIVDSIKIEAMKVPRLRDLLKNDLIHIGVNIDVDNISVMSEYLGTIRDPENPRGLSVAEFQERQANYREAEIRSMLDVGGFIKKALRVYGYENFVNDAGGSLCDITDIRAEGIDSDPVLRHLGKRTLIVHINSSEENRAQLIRRSSDAPKPIYYRPDFLDQQLQPYRTADGLSEDDLPGRFQALIFERLIHDRQSRYETIARHWGCTLEDSDVGELTDLWMQNPRKLERPDLAADIEQRFLALLARALDTKPVSND